MHEGLVLLPAVAGIVESGPPDVELQGGSSIAVAAVSNTVKVSDPESLLFYVDFDSPSRLTP